MVCDNTTIIVYCKNIDTLIANNIRLLSSYAINHQNINEILFVDMNSQDLTSKIICEQTLPKTRYIGKYSNDRDMLLSVLPQIKTDNVIIIEGELYTRLHQIRLQIKRLRKVCLVLPSRFHKKTKITWNNKKHMISVKTDNATFKMLGGIRMCDVTNTNKAFKKKKVLELLDNTLNKEYCWPEMISLAIKKDYRISVIETHYVMPIKDDNDLLIKGINRFIEMIRIKK